MRLALRFLIRLLAWTAGLVALVTLAALLGEVRGGLRAADVLSWVGGMLAFAGFPAGIAVATQVLDWNDPRIGRMVAFTGAALAVAVAVFALRGYVAPAILADPGAAEDVARGGAALAGLDPATLPLGERIAALRLAEAEAEKLATQEAWLVANRIGWHVDGTLTGAIGAFVFGWLGVLVGAWAGWTSRPEVRQAQFWAIGLFLLVTGYLMGENSYELILLKMNGPAYVTAWFPLIAPGMLLAGLAFATGARLLGSLAPPGLLGTPAS